MQTLGISDPSERPDSRLKSLLWPSVQSGADVDYLGAQGYWVCTFVAVISFLFALMIGRPLFAATLLLFYHLGGVGVRQRDLFAAAIVFGSYALDTIVSLVFLMLTSPAVVVIRVAVFALLLSNLRATWIASNWHPNSEQAALPPRMGDTFSDKFADLWPQWIWPKVRIIYYIFALGVVLLGMIGVTTLLLRATHLNR
jgi:hypothetical protein